MVSTLRSPARPAYAASRWPDEPLDDATLAPTHQGDDLRFPIPRPSLGKQVLRALARFLIISGIGVAGTLAWQSYGDVARGMIAELSPRLAWLAPPVGIAQTMPDMTAPTSPPADLQQLQTMSLGLAEVRQSVEQLAAQLALGQQQMRGEIARLQEVEQSILHTISAPPPRPAAAPARKPAPPTPLVPQAPPPASPVR